MLFLCRRFLLIHLPFTIFTALRRHRRAPHCFSFAIPVALSRVIYSSHTMNCTLPFGEPAKVSRDVDSMPSSFAGFGVVSRCLNLNTSLRVMDICMYLCIQEREQKTKKSKKNERSKHCFGNWRTSDGEVDDDSDRKKPAKAPNKRELCKAILSENESKSPEANLFMNSTPTPDR